MVEELRMFERCSPEDEARRIRERLKEGYRFIDFRAACVQEAEAVRVLLAEDELEMVRFSWIEAPSPDIEKEEGPKYRSEEKRSEDIKNRFSYHAPITDQPARYERLWAKALELALLFDKFCPESREKALALTKLEESIMLANASIARNE